MLLLTQYDSPEQPGRCSFSDELDGCELVWNDEFHGSEIDETKWPFDRGDGCGRREGLCSGGNYELLYYTNRPEKAFMFGEGALVIRARREIPAGHSPGILHCLRNINHILSFF